MPLTSFFTDFFFPAHCVLCKKRTASYEYNICSQCQLTTLRHTCYCCATPLEPPNKICGSCQNNPPPWSRAIIPLAYSAETRFCIHLLKYKKKTYLAQSLASQFIKNLPKDTTFPDFIIPVPLHKKKLYLRGFNQAALLAQQIGKKLNLKSVNTICQRIKHTESQTGKTASERKTNLLNAFHVLTPEKLKNKHIVVLDDVYTTGTTTKTLCHELRKHQTKQIDVWCIGRTSKKASHY